MKYVCLYKESVTTVGKEFLLKILILKSKVDSRINIGK